ncbi:MAG TPA: ferric reductase-like transmembrane domain-containing protein [Pseudonocardiaceae bacterium]
MPYTRRRVLWGPWIIGCAFVALAASVVHFAVMSSHWLSGLAILVGAVAYAMMATNLFLAIRRPFLEKLFGPLDRVYLAHRLIGTSILGVLTLHVVLIPIASVVDSGVSILTNPGAAIPLGVLGILLLVGSIVLSVNPNVSYSTWQRVHLATGLAFLVLTAHMLAGASAWVSLASPAGVVLGLFALLGVVSLVIRLVDKARGGVRYTIVDALPRERGLEIVLRPEGSGGIGPHRPGQFVFLTAAAGNRPETHPFTLTNMGDAGQLSLLIRSSGDWTSQARTGLAVGDRVRVDGPFGAFTPSVDTGAPQHQVWVAGGAGITPFLSVLRTANGSTDRQVELVVAARDAADMPCWDELSTFARDLPWLTLTPAFSAQGDRLDDDTVDRLVAGKPTGTAWYLCGPAGLIAIVQRKLNQVPGALVHHEQYEWRAQRRPQAERDQWTSTASTPLGS